MLYGVVYKITNKVNGKSYVGQTTQRLAVRISQHKRERRNVQITNAIKKYGILNFEISILEKCENQDQLDQKEIFYIKTENTIKPNGYNLRLGGAKGKLHESTKKKLSISATGRRHKKRTPEQCLNTSLALGSKDYNFVPKTGRINSTKKAVEGINLISGVVILFDSTVEAQKNGFHRGKISECCSGKRKIHKGYSWRYV